MKMHRIMAVVVRHLYNFRHSWDKVVDAFYWPVMDLLLWGLTSKFILEGSSDFPNIVLVLLTGLVYWQIVWRGTYEITTNLLEELWSKNMVNFFATPMKISEWVLGVLSLGFVKMVVTVGFASLVAWLLYAVNIYAVGFLFLPFLALLLMTGWFVGFLVSGVIISFGTRIQMLAWAGVYVLAPFSGIYYPISTLPEWAQLVARFVPTSYVFAAMREVLNTGNFKAESLLISFGLNLVYLLIAVVVFVALFNKRKIKGLSQLE